MMNVLLESKPRRNRKSGGAIFSIVFHAAVVFFAVYATARAGVPDVREDRAEKVTFVKTKKVEPKPVDVADYQRRAEVGVFDVSRQIHGGSYKLSQWRIPHSLHNFILCGGRLLGGRLWPK